MSKRRNAAQDALEVEITGQDRGRVERRVAASVLAARRAGILEPTDDALAIVAVELARSVDRAARIKPDPYAVAAAGRELRVVLVELGLSPASRKPVASDPLQDFLDSLDDDDPLPAQTGP